MCFLCSGKPQVIEEPPQHITTSLADHEPPPGIGVFECRPYLPPSHEEQKQQKRVSKSEPFPMEFSESDWKPSPKKFSPNTTHNPLPPSTEGKKQQKKDSEPEPPPMKFSESDCKPSPKKFSPNTTYVRSPSPVLKSDSDDTKGKKSKKTSSTPDRKLAISDSETTYASNPMHATDHFPAEWKSDSNKPTTRKTGHESKLSPSPPPEKLNTKSTELSENITRRFPTSDEVTRNTTESPTKARDDQNAKASNTSSNNKKLVWNEKEHTESPYKDAASSLHYQTAISDSEKDQNIPYW